MKRILVVGCGPTGLTVASILKTYGVDVTLIDRYPGVLKATKAAAIHARTLEVLDTIGCAERIVGEGQKVEYLNLRTAREDRLVIRFDELQGTRYPFMIDLPQYRTEEILIDRLKEMGVDLRRAMELVHIEDGPDGVAVKLEPKADDGKTAAGPAQNYLFDYVVACDGVHSRIRDAVGLMFSGESYADPWCLTDAEVEWPIPRNEMTFSSDETGICGMFPLPEPGHFRVVYTQMFDAAGKAVPPDRDNMLEAMKRTGETPKVGKIGKFWTFDLDHRQVARYRVGRIFLVGDAAHVHTPFGGQGMNLGISDAQNLAWKLAAVANGQAEDSLLDTYNAERHPVAAGVIKLTDLGARAMLVRKGPKAKLRDLGFELLNLPDVFKKNVAGRLSQLTLSYRDHSIFDSGIGKGDRLPDEYFHDGYTSQKHWLHDRIPPGTVNVVCAPAGDHEAPVDRFAEALAQVKKLSPVPVRTSIYTRFSVEGRERFTGVDDWVYDHKALLRPVVPYDASVFLVRPDSFVAERHVDPTADKILAEIGRIYGRV